MKKIVVLGVTSGIAAYKTLDLIRLLKKEGVDVQVIMTKHATLMVSPKEFEKASGNKIFIELFEKDFDYKTILKRRKVDHIDLADKANALVIVPATANIIAKLAYGFADDFLTTTALATKAPLIVAPAMNVNMWHNEAVRKNLEILKKRGVQIIGPTWGMLACGYEGEGRLENLAIIKDAIINAINYSQSLKGKNIIVTAGGTSEKIDEVRSITNKSSGKMGAVLARECVLRGGDVLLLRAKNSVEPAIHVKQELFSTAEELLTLIKKYALSHDIIFHSAAVSDFQVKNNYKGKISSKKSTTLTLEPQKKILDEIKKINPQIFLVAFKAEYALKETELITVAFQRLKESKADLIVANDISKSDRGFEADTNEVFIINKRGDSLKIPLSSKQEIAQKIIEYITSLRRTKR